MKFIYFIQKNEKNKKIKSEIQSMGRQSTSNKQNKKIREESVCKKDINTKHTINSSINELNKVSNGNYKNCQVINKVMTSETNLKPLIERIVKFEKISDLTILDGIKILLKLKIYLKM